MTIFSKNLIALVLRESDFNLSLTLVNFVNPSFVFDIRISAKNVLPILRAQLLIFCPYVK